MSLNSVSLVGRVGGDPDVKYFESGIALQVHVRTYN